ncbi:CdiI family contact-dependent growth inhibition immunity protein [Microvirga sp. HBU67558]|uniref:contact-dependent growth inhibition system immunity protein n=1 Tax=Microvirga TaxID=186650 RepID=UPI001B392912|nr:MULTISPECIES: contact-dependent growth inhibition system immunity protein [unclassified Microvirga]MBQ0824178.1 CdiI family contact-dependent growth inhibition immunity protein [Microvirga sp. HBU67558]
MKIITQRKWSSAYKNDDFICIVIQSGYRSSAIEANEVYRLLSIDVDNEILGSTINECLSRSRFLSLEEIPDFFDLLRVERDYALWVGDLINRYKYKTKRALFKNMLSCNMVISDGSLRIEPTIHEKLEGWSGQGKEQATANFSYGF